MEGHRIKDGDQHNMVIHIKIWDMADGGTTQDRRINANITGKSASQSAIIAHKFRVPGPKN